MKTISIKYPTVTQQRKIGDKIFVLECIRDLDEAIDLICSSMSSEDLLDPFAEDLCPYFGILWPAAEGLSIYLSENAEVVRGKKVLELGCGLGLPSLVSSYLGASVLATDFHPDVEEYFFRNCRHSSLKADYKRMNWREDISPVDQFDVVLGSDVLYESKHPEEVAKGLLKYVRPGGTIILSDPGRAYVQNFVKFMNDRGQKEEMSFVKVDTKDIFIFKFTV